MRWRGLAWQNSRRHSAIRQALKAAQQAVALEPNLARTQTVLGFAYLTQVKTRKAKEAFEKAIALDQADPLPRLGMGLAIIRDGELKEGSRDLEIAASLDPNNALIRSYLGKAYYEEKRGELDEREFEVAKQLDPNDPTPWFYSAMRSRPPTGRLRPCTTCKRQSNSTTTGPSIARVCYSIPTWPRAVPARRASTAIWASSSSRWSKAGNRSTPIRRNYSAHRFLADSYSALPRHEIARVSELLQSQLLQPINITPIQPRLAESNLFLISAGGPGGLSFNEFNPLFNRNGYAIQASGLVGEHDTYAGEGVLSGIAGSASYSIGYAHFETGGFRKNADQEDGIFNAFFQQELTSQTSIQAEYRYRHIEHGDLSLRFFPEDFFPSERSTEERHTVRLGARHALSPSSVILGSFMYQDAKFSLRDDQVGEPITFVSLERPETAFSIELQHLFRSRFLNLTSGTGYFDINGRVDQVTGLDLPPPIGPEISSTASTDLDHFNAYVYSYINLLKNVSFTVGLSIDVLSGGSLEVGDQTQVNPKFGITWEPIRGTTLRAAAFRVLKRTLITDQTLEPTQVAGFNQFFDDFNGTESWRYGAAIDQRFTKDLFGGVEFSKRDLEFKVVDIISDPEDPESKTLNADEALACAYLFWTPHPWLAFRVDYMFERFEQDVLTDRTEIDTHRVPLGINFFHPSGMSASLAATYWNQDGTFQRITTGEIEAGSDKFWTVDTAINYRLPKRYGFITIGATNLFDQDFKFFDRDAQNSVIQPTRTVFGKVTLAFP